jgi:predicted amidohydrolase
MSINVPVNVPVNGRDYDRVELKKPMLSVAAIQSRVRAVDASNPAKGMRENMAHMLELLDATMHYGAPKDLVCFHEFPVSGWSTWNREQALNVAISLPGEESEQVSQAARKYGCYVSFGAYVQDPDWPGHVLSITSLIGPDGSIVAKHWKCRNIRGVFPGFELFTTTIENVLDPYREMYGADAVIPVARTPIGNITMSSSQRNPEFFRACAMKGAEIFVRTATGGFTTADVQMSSVYNSVYSILTNNAVSPGNPGFFEDSGGGSGGSVIYGPRGETLAEAKSAFEQDVTAMIPLAAFRATHTIPDVDTDLYRPVWDAYSPRFPSSAFASGAPNDLQHAKQVLSERDRWV